MTKKLTRKEVQQIVHGCITAPSEFKFGWAENIVAKLEAKGALSIAPEPVAPKRGDLLTEATELVDRMVVRDRDGEVFAYWEAHGTWYCADGHEEQFTTAGVINYGARIIDVPGVVDTPEPAPKYVAERIGSWLTVDGFSMPSERIQLEAEIGRRQAALDLLDSEEKEANDYNATRKPDGWEANE